MLKLYTKTGDTGDSGIIGGNRLGKNDLIFDVLGTFDELNAQLGLAVVLTSRELRKELLQIQDTLLQIGAEIAGSKKFKLTEEDCVFLEKRIDEYQKNTREDWYKKFLLPGGIELAARLDVVRTVCRRLERLVVSFSQKNSNVTEVLKYINRLSDYFFALRCFVNSDAGYEEKEFQSDYLRKSSL